METTDLLGYIAGTLTTAALVPQVWRTFRTRDVSGISLRMYSIFTIGIAVWLAYGVLLREMPMMLSNSFSLLMACAVLAMKLKYRNGDGGEAGGRAAAAAQSDSSRWKNASSFDHTSVIVSALRNPCCSPS